MPRGRLMALDYGRRRIGVAVTDPTRTIAAPHGVVERSNRRAPGTAVPDALTELVAKLEPAGILVGIPFSMDGTAGEMAQEARAFAQALEDATGVRTIEWDERLSTARAEREILRMDLPRGRRRQKGRTDEMAASLMLSAYLRSAPGGGGVPPGT
ncbi:Holliday junction resolvase RuvX [Candidatus Palauibacter sp.]|uniref:Holliday junction resolvase RuvX n=1 Tax=Candidatus Palauibacter sp. TaxID=3101350 RepID=UPI003B0138FA